jgi:oligosaccharide repeat unit polymerase
MDVFGKCLALVFSLMILGQAYLVRRYVGTWLFPACLFGLFWFVYTFVPLAFLFWVPVQPYAIAFIFLCTLAFSIGSLPFDWKTAFERNARKRETTTLVYGSHFLRVVFYASTLASLVFLALNFLAQGISLKDLFFDLFASAAAYADLHYSESLRVHILDRLSLVFAYVGAILGGFVFPSTPSRIRRWLIVVLSFLPPTLVAVTQTAKGLLFLCIVFFYAGLLVYRASAGTLLLFEKGTVKSLTPYAALLILIVTMSFMSRGLTAIEDNEEVMRNLIGRFASYSCGHIYAFSDWFAFIVGSHSEIVYPHESAAHGFYTFMAVFDLVGSHNVVPQGVFDDYSYGNWLTTNIFTVFRGLIQDFGFIGSVLFMLATGILLHRAFHTMLRNRRPVFTVAVFVFAMGYFYTSFIISMLVWINIYVSFVLLWIVLQINKRITQTGGRRLASPETPVGTAPCLPS